MRKPQSEIKESKNLQQVPSRFADRFTFIDSLIHTDDDQYLRSELEQLRNEVLQLLQLKSEVELMDQRDLKLLLCTFIPVIRTDRPGP